VGRDEETGFQVEQRNSIQGCGRRPMTEKRSARPAPRSARTSTRAHRYPRFAGTSTSSTGSGSSSGTSTELCGMLRNLAGSGTGTGAGLCGTSRDFAESCGTCGHSGRRGGLRVRQAHSWPRPGPGHNRATRLPFFQRPDLAEVAGGMAPPLPLGFQESRLSDAHTTGARWPPRGRA
jgi:hypothetical protein